MRTQATALVLLAAVLCWAGCATPQAERTKRVLFFSKSSGFEHSVIHRSDNKLSFAEEILQGLGASNKIEFTFTKDGGVFTPTNIATYDAFIFYTTGNLTEAGKDRNPPMSKEGKAALLEAIKEGKGFVGIHSATDTFHSPGNYGPMGLPAGYKNDGTNADPYIQMLGAEFIAHGSTPQYQKSRMICADTNFPGLGALPADFGPLEEWYSLKNFAPDLHVLLVQDTSTMVKTGKCFCYDRAPYPATWAHRYGKGRVFYTSMGHREDVWTNPVFQQVLLGGINWAVRRCDADVTPNLDKVAPGAAILPKYR